MTTLRCVGDEGSRRIELQPDFRVASRYGLGQAALATMRNAEFAEVTVSEAGRAARVQFTIRFETSPE